MGWPLLGETVPHRVISKGEKELCLVLDRCRRVHTSSDLLCDFKDDMEFYRHPEWKAGNADHQPSGCFLDTKDISKQVRDGVRDPGLVEEVPRGCYEYSEPDDSSHSIERAQMILAAARTLKALLRHLLVDQAVLRIRMCYGRDSIRTQGAIPLDEGIDDNKAIHSLTASGLDITLMPGR